MSQVGPLSTKYFVKFLAHANIDQVTNHQISSSRTKINQLFQQVLLIEIEGLTADQKTFILRIVKEKT